METEKIHSIEHFLKPALIGDVEVFITIDEIGRASVTVIKDGKILRDIPTKIKDNEYVKELKAVHKALKDSRAHTTLEKTMEAEDEFTADELRNLSDNPVIYPLIQNLVLKMAANWAISRIMHLLTYKTGNLICSRKIDSLLLIRSISMKVENGQHTRRIFLTAELYRPNADELEARTLSRRYDGYQIQPKKAAALLKGRGWTASYEEGLQKVYYKENIIAKIYAMADWFSPADVEAPTLEGIEFHDRINGKAVPFTKVPEVIFSEIMSDVDLVVSVAHIGGVDPEASLSTIEMRTVIIAEMIRLLKLTNVELKGSHAFINGSLGQYTVHLGSGVAHKMARGALNIITCTFSAQRAHFSSFCR